MGCLPIKFFLKTAAAIGIFFLSYGPLSWAEPSSENAGRAALFITGLSGSHQFEEYFQKTPERIRKTLLANGYRKENMVSLSEKISEAKPWGRETVSTKENIDLELIRFSVQAQDYDEVFVFIAGHANGHGEEAVLHLPGDDMSVTELIEKLDAISAKRIFIVAAVSQGETWIQKLGRPGRVIIAGGGDRQYDFIPVIFLRIFPEVFLNPLSAGSKNTSEVSLLDIFSETQQKVKQWYKANQLQCTELALMDADGDGQGESLLMEVPEPEMEETAPSPAAAAETKLSGPDVIVVEPSPASGAGPKVETVEFPLNLNLPDAKASALIYFRIPKGDPA